MKEKVSGGPNYKDDLLSLDISQRSTDITLDSNLNLFEPLNLFFLSTKGTSVSQKVPLSLVLDHTDNLNWLLINSDLKPTQSRGKKCNAAAISQRFEIIPALLQQNMVELHRQQQNEISFCFIKTLRSWKI